MERRGAERYDASSLISFDNGLGEGRAELTDLSLGGCRLRGLADGALARGQEVELKLIEGLETRATVCWVEGGAAGLKFLVPITMATLAYFRFAQSITVLPDTPLDSFGRPLPPLGGRFAGG